MWLCEAIHLPSYILCLISNTVYISLYLPLHTSLCHLPILSSLSHGCLYSLPCYPFSDLCSSKNGMFSASNAQMVKSTRTHLAGREKNMKMIRCQATSIPADRVPDMAKRELMNWLLLGAISLPTAGMLIPYTSFFVPPGSGGAGEGTVAKDALGNDVIAAEWLKTHGPGDRTLTQGLKTCFGKVSALGIWGNKDFEYIRSRAILYKDYWLLLKIIVESKLKLGHTLWGDPTYLVVENDRSLATFGINAVCTHLGCVVPWNSAENKFICPCHGSQYNNQGRVVRGPAPLILMMGKFYSFHGLKQISEPARLHGGLKTSIPNLSKM
ncbi:unnamed protein product [Camellia sinensis]